MQCIYQKLWHMSKHVAVLIDMYRLSFLVSCCLLIVADCHCFPWLAHTCWLTSGICMVWMAWTIVTGSSCFICCCTVFHCCSSMYITCNDFALLLINSQWCSLDVHYLFSVLSIILIDAHYLGIGVHWCQLVCMHWSCLVHRDPWFVLGSSLIRFTWLLLSILYVFICFNICLLLVHWCSSMLVDAVDWHVLLIESYWRSKLFIDFHNLSIHIHYCPSLLTSFHCFTIDFGKLFAEFCR